MRNGIVAGEPGMFPWPRGRRLLRWLSRHRHPESPPPVLPPVTELDPKPPAP
jgi:hypothetical protein